MARRQAVIGVDIGGTRIKTVLVDPEVTEINPVYKDILPYVIKVMNIKENIAEKVRAVLTRDNVRDLYDLSILVGNRGRFDRDLIDKKLTYYDMRFDTSAFIERCNELSKRWYKDLGSLMEHVPPKDKAVELIRIEASNKAEACETVLEAKDWDVTLGYPEVMSQLPDVRISVVEIEE